MYTINMLSSADKIKGQGVASAYQEQVELVSSGLADKYSVYINSFRSCDIMHYHTINLGYYLTSLAERKGQVKVGYVHFLPETIEKSIRLPGFAKKVFYNYIISFYKNMDYLVTVNPYFIGELAKYGISADRITYIPNFVSEESFYEQDSETVLATKKRLGIPTDSFVVLGVGQVQTRKGVQDFCKVAQLLPDKTFVWAGGFSFGIITDGYADLKKLMDCPPPNVKFLGILDRKDMNNVYNIADCLFQPSYSELFPMTILEAMCCNKPLLLRDLDIYRNILFDFYAKDNTNEGFASTLHEIATSASAYQALQKKSQNGHMYYSRESVLRMWELFYDRVAAECALGHIYL